jgi:hypothetical protein
MISLADSVNDLGRRYIITDCKHLSQEYCMKSGRR